MTGNVTVDLGGWEENWKRVLRMHAKLKGLCNGLPAGMTREDAIDLVMSFFPVCHHLSDALVRGRKVREIDMSAFIKSNDVLALCRDFTIGMKHFEIREPYRPIRTLSTATYFPPFMSGSSGSPQPCMPINGEQWMVTTDADSVEEQSWDVFDLADDCVGEWQQFIDALPGAVT